MNQYNILHGCCLDELQLMPDNSVDSCVTDPPYELGFMGKKWDAAHAKIAEHRVEAEFYSDPMFQ